MTIRSKSYPFHFMVLFILLGLFVVSCKKEEPQEETTASQAIYELLEDVYFWYDRMPDIDPKDFDHPSDLLEAIRFNELDRWSYITSREAFEAYYQDSRIIGYGMGIKWDENDKLRVSFVFNSVEMYQSGIRRSWIIDAINGVEITPSVNVNELFGPNEIGHTNEFRFIKPDGEIFEQSFAKQEVTMNTILHSDIIEHADRKIGYFVLQGFTTPTLDELEETFAYFQQNEIDELILDLRYNGGGQTNVANYLSAALGGAYVADKVFAKYIFNDKRNDKDRDELFEATSFELNLERVFFITTQSSASASEMVINGLMPHIPVISFGTKTHGKPVGMEAWYYDVYAIAPITFKIANSDGVAEYYDGLDVNFPAADGLAHYFGDPEEASLKAVLEFIETGITKSAPSVVTRKQPQEDLEGIRSLQGVY